MFLTLKYARHVLAGLINIVKLLLQHHSGYCWLHCITKANLTQLTFPIKYKHIYELKKFYEIDLLASLFSLNFGKTLSSMILIKLHFSCFLFLKAHIQEAKVVNVQSLRTMEGELLTSHGSVVSCNYITGQKAHYGIKFTCDLHLLCTCSTAWL